MNRRRTLWLLASLPAATPGLAAEVLPREALSAQLKATETAFADTLARRDVAGFASHLADDAVFIDGDLSLRGKAAVLGRWGRFFVAPTAPFSWQPDLAEVTEDGLVGHTEGPVRTPAGEVIARFFTTWRRGADGRWRVAFDTGARACRD